MKQATRRRESAGVRMRVFNQSTTFLGTVEQADPQACSFTLKLRTGDIISLNTGAETSYGVLQNLDGLPRDRVISANSAQFGDGTPQAKVAKYLRKGDTVFVKAIQQIGNGAERIDARDVKLMHFTPEGFLFEDETHWWLSQISQLANQWLDDLFADKRSYKLDDFVELYRTNLNIIGLPTDDNTQEMATLSRLIYGLSSAYLLTGAERYLLAAKAGVQFQRDAFRSLSHDGKYCFWASARQRGLYANKVSIPSTNGDDAGTIPLYEQIYALAGLAQYYRITGEWEVLEDIHRTMLCFDDFFQDEQHKNPAFPGQGGYFSHIDPTSMRPDEPVLGKNRLKKNWNSIGDHIPAYLVNVILALDPLPQNLQAKVKPILDFCNQMLDRCVNLIETKFPDPNSVYVNERFDAYWQPDHSYSWQQNRAIVGHNLKIAWNLTRVANYYQTQGRTGDAARAIELAEKLARAMKDSGLDLVRGGCFDAVERNPSNGMPLEFVWGNTKDFWQQEQGILAYYSLFNYTGDSSYLDLARDMSAFWNMFFLDHENLGIFFRTTEHGMPVVLDGYGNKAGHAIAGYHAFELNYLAHIYIRIASARTNRSDPNFCLYFKLDEHNHQTSINVLPDFCYPGSVEIASITIDGERRPPNNPRDFQVMLTPAQLGCAIVVEFKPGAKRKP